MKRTMFKSPWGRKILALACASILCVGAVGLVAGCSNSSGSQSNQGTQEKQSEPQKSETRMFTDSLGREVEVPATIERIAPSGHTAQQVLFTIAPEMMVGLASEITQDQAKYLPDVNTNLPIFGAAFGASGDLNKEAVAAADPQIIIDTGEAKDGLSEDLDTLQEQLGIPCVFIETKLEDYGVGYTMLGDLLGKEDRGKELSDYCTRVYNETKDAMAAIPENERVNMAYLLGDAGLNAIAKNSYQGQVIDMCANNVAVVEKASGSGMGNEVSIEQLALWAPDLIVFGPDSIYDTVSTNPAWADIPAIATGTFYQVPAQPYNWLNSPPTVNQVMGMQWLPRLLYPDAFDSSIQDVTTEYYQVFYNCTLSNADFEELAGKAML